jgi:hypothetical protein
MSLVLSIFVPELSSGGVGDFGITDDDQLLLLSSIELRRSVLSMMLVL